MNGVITFYLSLCVCLPQVYIMLAKPEKNVRSAFTTSTQVRMHVGDAKTAANAAKPKTMAGLFRRKGSEENLRYRKGQGLEVSSRVKEHGGPVQMTSGSGRDCVRY